MDIDWISEHTKTLTPENIKALVTPFMSTLTALIVIILGWRINQKLEKSKAELQRGLEKSKAELQKELEYLKSKLAVDNIIHGKYTEGKFSELTKLHQSLYDLYKNISDEYLMYQHAYMELDYNRQLMSNRIKERIYQEEDMNRPTTIELGIAIVRDKQMSAFIYLTDELNNQVDFLLTLTPIWQKFILDFLLHTYKFLNTTVDVENKDLVERALSEWDEAFSKAETERNNYLRELKKIGGELKKQIMINEK